MPKGINLKESYRHSGKGCEFYLVRRVEPSSILPTPFQRIVCKEICSISAMYVGLVEAKCYEECTY